MTDNSAQWPTDTFGIYLLLDRESGRINVGSTRRTFQTRWRDHRDGLRHNRHFNQILQRSFNRDGEGAFVMMVVEVISVCDPKHIAERENHWIRELQSRVENGGFNLKDGEAMAAYSDVTRALIRQLAYMRKAYQFRFKGPDGVVIDVPDLPAFCATRGLHPDMMTQVFTGKRRSHGGYVKHDSEYVPRGYRNVTFISPEGVEHPTRNVTEFARERGLGTSCMISLARGDCKQHRGWTVKGEQRFREDKKRRTAPYPARAYDFRTPTGEMIHIEDLTTFCRENGLDRQTMAAVDRGEKRSYKGYTRTDATFVPRCKRYVTLVAPTGEEHVTNNLAKFGREHGLSKECLSQLCKGRLKTTLLKWQIILLFKK